MPASRMNRAGEVHGVRVEVLWSPGEGQKSIKFSNKIKLCNKSMCVRLGCQPGQAAVSYWEPKWLEISDFLNPLLNISYSAF